MTAADRRAHEGAEIKVTLLTGGFDRPYAFGLAMAMASEGLALEVVGSDEVDSPEMHTTPHLDFLNLRGHRQNGLAGKIKDVLLYYARLFRYAAIAEPKIFHILWNNKFEKFDRTLLMLYYKLLGKKIALTVHNVNAGKRDLNDSLLNRLTLRAQYAIVDHMFVHTKKMKWELVQDFSVEERKVSVIPYGINNSVPDTALTSTEAKRHFGIGKDEKTILFFGALRPYKGLEYLLEAFRQLAAANPSYRLIVAAEPKKGSEKYFDAIQKMIARQNPGQIIQRFQYVPDEEAELYFKAADVLVLPYTYIFQSGILFMAFSFGLPVVASDVGSLREDIVEGKTGFLARPCDSANLAKVIERYFESDLFKTLDRRRQEIRHYANEQHSWKTVAEITRQVYADLLIQSCSIKSQSV